MRRVSRKWPNLSEAMRFLGVEPPRVPRGASQATLEELLEAWKIGVLKKAYRKRAQETHPDLGGSDEEFDRVKSAYDEIREYAKLAAPRQKPISDPHIRSSNPFFTGGTHFRPREPRTEFRDVHPSGFDRADDPRVRVRTVKKDPAIHGINKCLRCESDRFGDYAGEASFCHRCGADYEEMTQEAIVAFADQMNKFADSLEGFADVFQGFADAFKRRHEDDD